MHLCNNCAVSRDPGDVKRRIVLSSVDDMLRDISKMLVPKSGKRMGLTIPLPPDFNPSVPRNN